MSETENKNMTDFNKIFQTLWHTPESEVVEFKEAKESFDIDDLGKYFSALSNEANLRGMDFGWLIFGVNDKKRSIVGTNFKNSEKALHKLKNDMAQHTTGNHIFREIKEIELEGKRVLIFQIPASPRNIVMCWKNIAWARNGESLKPLDQGKMDEIRNQSPIRDWSAEIVPDATMDDLDELALAKARIEFTKAHKEHIAKEEIESWTMAEFLSNSEVMRDGKLTRAAILLLGKPMTARKLAPAVAQITWCLNDDEGNPIDYEHFGVPYILTVDKVLAKVRNLTMRELPEGTLFPDVQLQYDSYTMREALHNCIAHMDYRREERITVVENPGNLCYSNGGIFAPGSVEEVLEHIGPQRYYRNRCLCNAMVHFNMIDTIGRGIRKMFSNQRERFFPMPDYLIDKEKCEVTVVIYGKVIDERYTRLLRENRNLTLQECVWLDAVQKGRLLDKKSVDILRKRGLVEGRYPQVYVSERISRSTGQIGTYIKNRGLSRRYYKDMLISYLEKKIDGAKRHEIDEFLMPMLPNTITNPNSYIGNLLAELKAKEQKIIYLDNRWWLDKNR